MRKTSFILSFLLALTSLSYGKAVSLSTAKTVGYNYLHQKGAVLTNADGLNLVYTSGASPATFYVFGGDNCFVIVAADDNAQPILGYSKDNIFSTSHIPSNLSYMLGHYSKQINYAVSNNITAAEATTTQWNNLINNIAPKVAARTTSVPLLGSLQWDQYPYYNADCPADPGAGAFGGTDVTGCVATAMAQVMKFWSWPATGVGFHSYTTSSYGTLSADFGGTPYNWASMPNSVSGPNAAVATLMYDCGVSVEMNYTPSESGSYVTEASSPITNCAEYALKTYFNYASTLHGGERMDYTEATWISMLKAEIDGGRPIIYAGTGPSGGHCFVFDDYDASSNFHVNWGWSGVDNGYYPIDALDPATLGAGGGGGGFDDDQDAIFGIKPSAVIVSSSMDLASPLTVTASPSTSNIQYNTAFTVSTSVHNGGASAFSGSYTALVLDASGTVVDSVQVLAGSLAAGATSGTLTFNTPGFVSLGATPGLPAMLPGNYTIEIFARATSSSWALLGSTIYPNSAAVTITNSDPIELYDVMTPSPATFVQGSPASVTTSFANYSSADFSGSYEIVLLNMDATVNSTIQVLSGLPTLPMGSAFSPDVTFSTTNVTAAPGTYLLTAAFSPDGISWYYAGADLYQNPTFVTVIAPPPSPDMYEVNNTAATAYDLTSTLSWSANVAHTGTPGSNFHVVTDQDYYKLVLPTGYSYSITARINDIVSKDDGVAYTVDAVWSYSTDGGTTWSSVYDDVMTGTPAAINLGGSAGGTVIFHVSPHYAGNIGTYLLKISNITRRPDVSVTNVALDESVKIFPNPVSSAITVDLTGANATGIDVALMDMQGKTVYTADVSAQSIFTVPVNALAPGMYFLQVSTDAGIINKKITVTSK